MAGDTDTDENDNVQVEMDVDIVVTDGIMCGKCLKVYSTKRKLSQHKRDVHQSARFPYYLFRLQFQCSLNR